MNTIKPNYNISQMLGLELTPRERELAAAVLQLACSSACQSQALVCPDDVGLIRSTQATGTARVDVAVAVPVGGSIPVTLPNLGLPYCLSFGLELATSLGAADNYDILVARGGITVASVARVELAGGTANERSAGCQCCICVGAVQGLTLTFVNTGAAAWPVGTFIQVRVCRDFDRVDGSVACKGGC